MAYTRREFYTKDKEIQKYIDKLMTKSVVEMPPKMAQDLGRNKTIQTIRDMDRRNPYILICRDQKYHISVMKTREPLKIVKIGDKYVFSF
jgi:predicted nuclease of predicted toxin-antitoxin system